MNNEFKKWQTEFLLEIPSLLKEEYSKQFAVNYIKYVIQSNQIDAFKKWQNKIHKRIKLQQKLMIWHDLKHCADMLTISKQSYSAMKKTYMIKFQETASREDKIKKILEAGILKKEYAEALLSEEWTEERFRAYFRGNSESNKQKNLQLQYLITTICNDEYTRLTGNALITFDYEAEQIRFFILEKTVDGEEELYREENFTYVEDKQIWQRPLTPEAELSLYRIFGKKYIYNY